MTNRTSITLFRVETYIDLKQPYRLMRQGPIIFENISSAGDMGGQQR